MSGEQLAQQEVINNTNSSYSERVDAGIISERKVTARVDINDLMSKVRDEKKRQRKENLVFFGIVSSIIVVTGIIASL